MASSSKRLVEIEIALKSERVALAIEKVELFKSQKVVNATRMTLAAVEAKALVDFDAT